MPPFQKVLVANRGEIAVRVMAACEELGIETVAVYSDADATAGHVAYADEAYNVGPAPARESYLDQEAILDAAASAGAEAIHPGYGFFAENAGFARRVEESDAAWIGPSSDAMERLGEKTRARRVMEDAGVPVVPGTTGPVESAARVGEFAEEHGYPVAIKAAGGGGGRGLVVVGADDDVEKAFDTARRAGEAYFDDSTVYVEKYLEAPRHVEVQILADEYGTVLHLGERDCSLQRRHQKLVEEAPSPALDDDLREAIGEAARAGVREADYTNAGTVEFLVEDGQYYFMEVNTRIQVEHTVTEEVTGIDVVREQLRVAAGEELSYQQSDVTVEGHAMEFRINAEDPSEDFAPSTGTLGRYDPPGGIGVRVDDAVAQGDTVTGDYDSLIAKLVVRAPTRERCIARSERALRHFEVAGPETTIPFHRLMLDDEAFRAGEHTTKFVDEAVGADDLAAAVERWGSAEVGEAGSPSVSRSELAVEVDGRRYEVRVVDGLPRVAPGTVHSDEGESSADPSGTESTSGIEPTTTAGGSVVAAEMQGTVLSVDVAPGDQVSPGDVLCVLEAMKMENDVVAPVGGTVAEVPVAAGDSVDMGDPLVVFE